MKSNKFYTPQAPLSTLECIHNVCGYMYACLLLECRSDYVHAC